MIRPASRPNAETRTEAAQAQATERLDALKTEQQARKADAEAHQKALAEERIEWKERLASIEKQRENAEKRAQEAETARVKAILQVELLSQAVEAQKAEKENRV
ncbi:hypothetical protein ACT3R7_20310 [Halomonas sp. AOP43-A1-21]